MEITKTQNAWLNRVKPGKGTSDTAVWSIDDYGFHVVLTPGHHALDTGCDKITEFFELENWDPVHSLPEKIGPISALMRGVVCLRVVNGRVRLLDCKSSITIEDTIAVAHQCSMYDFEDRKKLIETSVDAKRLTNALWHVVEPKIRVGNNAVVITGSIDGISIIATTKIER